MYGRLAIEKLLAEGGFHTVLDVGAGSGQQAQAFARAGKAVATIDIRPRTDLVGVEQIVGDFNTHDFGMIGGHEIADRNFQRLPRKFDLVWACHVLEHQGNPQAFLERVVKLTKEHGYIAITVPPLKHEIVGGHVTLWNGGLLLYHLVLAGLDCSVAHVMKYGYNISVVVQKRAVTLPRLRYDRGDLRAIEHLLPKELPFHRNATDSPFNGDIVDLRWDVPLRRKP